jgi:hypothetical protein
MGLTVYLSEAKYVKCDDTCVGCKNKSCKGYKAIDTDEEKFVGYISHELKEMGIECGIFNEVWRPRRNKLYWSNQIIEPLIFAIDELESRPSHYINNYSPNGEKSYSEFIKFLTRYKQACQRLPNTIVHANN